MKTNLTKNQKEELFRLLEARFQKHFKRHEGLSWEKFKIKLEANPAKLWSVHEMEKSGGEPDVIGFDKRSGEFIVCDCSTESPSGRRSLCYDREALNSRKENKPKNSALDMAEEMGINLLTEDQYHALQKLGNFDTKTSSWIQTPEAVRELGGAIFGDFRFNRVFIYHNGAESYYAARGFRGILNV